MANTKRIYLTERLNIYEPLDPSYYSPGGLPPDAGVDVADWISSAIADGLIVGAGGSGTFTALTGPITSGVNGGATTITNNAVTNAKLATMATATFKGRSTAGTGTVEDLSATQATALLDVFGTTTKGLVPAPTTITGKVLSDNGTWVTPAAGGTVDATPTSGSTNAVQSGGTFNALATKITSNSAITASTKTKITYDTKGLITAGTDATNGDVLSAASITIDGTVYAIGSTLNTIEQALATSTNNKQSTDLIVTTAATATESSYDRLVLVTATATRTLASATGTNIAGKTISYKNTGSGTLTIAPNGAETINGSNTAITVPAGEGVTLEITGSGTVQTIANLNTSGGGGGSANSKYSVTVSGSAGIVARVYGSSGIGITKTNASTLTFTIPASGYVENYQIFYPAAENPGSNATHVFNYTSNTITNQGNSTADAPNMIGWFASAVPTEIYHARAVGSSADFVNSITAIGSGNITILTNFGTTGLSSGDIILKGNF